jgi:hypothetical protein
MVKMVNGSGYDPLAEGLKGPCHTMQALRLPSINSSNVSPIKRKEMSKRTWVEEEMERSRQRQIEHDLELSRVDEDEDRKAFERRSKQTAEIQAAVQISMSDQAKAYEDQIAALQKQLKDYEEAFVALTNQLKSSSETVKGQINDN